MDGLFFLMSVAGVGCVMWWVLQNDRVRPDRPTTGLFALWPGSHLRKGRGPGGPFPAEPPPADPRKPPF